MKQVLRHKMGAEIIVLKGVLQDSVKISTDPILLTKNSD